MPCCTGLYARDRERARGLLLPQVGNADCQLWLPDPNLILPWIDGFYTTPWDTTRMRLAYVAGSTFHIIDKVKALVLLC